jgi:DNA-binding transcriptional regulator GbsR (MarR family)
MDGITNFFSHYFNDFEKGMNPIVGQIFGLLIQKTEPVSLTEIAEELDLSKAAISIHVRILSDIGYCVKLPRKKDRKDYYTINEYFLSQIYKSKIRQQELYFEELNRILSSEKSKNDKLNSFLSHLEVQISLQKKLLYDLTK